MTEGPPELNGLSRVVKTYVALTRQGMEDINGGMPRIIVGLHGLFMMFAGLKSEELNLDEMTFEDCLKFIVRCATVNTSGSPKAPPRALNDLFKNMPIVESSSSVSDRINDLINSFDTNLLKQVLSGIEPQNRYSTVQAAAKAVYDIMELKFQGSRFDALSSKHRLTITQQRSRKSLTRRVHR